MLCCFFFNDTATAEIYTLSLHDALPICRVFDFPTLLRPTIKWTFAIGPQNSRSLPPKLRYPWTPKPAKSLRDMGRRRSDREEHTSELQSRQYLVCRLLLEKKKRILLMTH